MVLLKWNMIVGLMQRDNLCTNLLREEIRSSQSKFSLIILADYALFEAIKLSYTSLVSSTNRL